MDFQTELATCVSQAEYLWQHFSATFPKDAVAHVSRPTLHQSPGTLLPRQFTTPGGHALGIDILCSLDEMLLGLRGLSARRFLFPPPRLLPLLSLEAVIFREVGLLGVLGVGLLLQQHFQFRQLTFQRGDALRL